MLFLCAVVLGGQGNKLGVIFGAFIIVYLPNRLLGVHFLGINMGDLKYLFFGLALVVMMIFRPEGLFPARQQLLAYGKAARDLLMKPGPDREGAGEMTIEELAGVHREIHAGEGEVLLGDKGFDREIRRPGGAGFGDVQHPPRRDPRPDRTQRRGQDHLLQRDHRRLPAQLGIGDVRRRTAGEDQTPPDHP